MRLSETTLRIRDEERQELIEEARRAAQKMIVSHRRHLDALAHELLENEVLDRDAIDRIMQGVPRLERTPGVGLRVVAAAISQPRVGPATIDLPPASQTGSPATTHTPIPHGVAPSEASRYCTVDCAACSTASTMSA